MSAKKVSDYYFSEILPIVAIGIVVNLLGSYFRDSLGIDLIFIDMIGTFVTAVLAGPWWAAMVAVAGNTINGTVFLNYFPFAVVNILGGLAWGYAARYRDSAGIFLHLDKKYDWHPILKEVLILSIVGIITCGIASSITKICLYIPMGRPIDAGEIYQLIKFSIDGTLQNFFHLNISSYSINLIVLFIGDLFRESIDKSLSCLIGVIVVLGLAPYHYQLRGTNVSGTSRLNVPAIPVIYFSILYGIYLFTAKLNHSEIIFPPHAKHSLKWLQEPIVVGWLYVPVIIALLVLIFLTITSESNLAQDVNKNRRRRESLYLRIGLPGLINLKSLEHHGLVQLAGKNGAYGLLVPILTWPIGKNLPSTWMVFIYLFSISTFVYIFFRSFRKHQKKLNEMEFNVSLIHKLISVPNIETNSVLFFKWIDWFSNKRGIIVEKIPLEKNGVKVISAAENNHLAPSGHSRQNKRFLFAYSDNNGQKLNIDFQTIFQIQDDLGIELAYVFSRLTSYNFSEHSEFLSENFCANRKIVPISFEDLEIETEELLKEKLYTDLFIGASNRLYNSLIGGRRSRLVDGPESVKNRSLQTIKHILYRIPGNSIVVDAGAGYGRHSLAALDAGHIVYAVEKKKNTFSALFQYLLESGHPTDKFTVICGDIFSASNPHIPAADLVIAAGMMQHLGSLEKIEHGLEVFQGLARFPGSGIYLELLLNLSFQGGSAASHRFSPSFNEIEYLINNKFGNGWDILVTCAPHKRKQIFTDGIGSFEKVANQAEYTLVEYYLKRH